jgi:hypothetical protein
VVAVLPMLAPAAVMTSPMLASMARALHTTPL